MAQTYSNIEPRGNVDKSATTLHGERLRRAAIVVAGLMIAATGSIANAAEHRRTGSAGEPIDMGGFAYWDSACNGAGARIEIARQPAHGRVEIRQAPMNVTTLVYGQADCRGRTVQSNHVIYIPDRTFHGEDRFAIHGFGGDGRKHCDDFFAVTVR